MHKSFILAMMFILVCSVDAKAFKIKAKKLGVAKSIITYLQKNHPKEDPLEYVALAWVESRLTPMAVSRTGDYGVLQVNYRIHKKKLKAKLGIHSKKELLELHNNINASVLIVNIMRKRYRHCRGKRLYSCYNGGPGWKKVQNRCLLSCAQNSSCRKCRRAFRYGELVKKVKRRLKRRYTELFIAPQK